MARIQSNVGLISGIPITETVAQLLAVEGKPRTRLAARTQQIKSEQSALTELTASVLGLQFSSDRLGNTDIYESKKASSSNSSSLSATVTGTPQAGNYQFTSIRQASSQQLLSSGVGSTTEPLSAGEISFSFGPRLDDSVSLDQLNAGEGVERGKIRITDRRGDTGVVDLRFVQSIDDVINAINANDDIDVTAVADGDRIKLVDNTGQTDSNLIVQDIGAGSTAADLGLSNIDVAAAEATGNDLLSLHEDTRLSDLNSGNGVNFNGELEDLEVTFRDGSESLKIALMQFPAPEGNATTTTNGFDAKVEFSSVTKGTAYDGVVIGFQDNPAITKGNETVVYNEITKTLTFQIDAGNTTAADVIETLNNDATAKNFFTAAPVNGGSGDGLIDVSDSSITAGGVGFANTETTSLNANASFSITALTERNVYDDVKIVIVAGRLTTKGNETVVYNGDDPENKTLTITIDHGESTAADVINAINADETVSQIFNADNASGNDGTGLVDLSDTGTTSGGFRSASSITSGSIKDGLVMITAAEPGAESDNVTLQYLHDETITTGNEVVEYDNSDPENIIITVRINQGTTSANDVIDAINNDATVSELFTAGTVSGGNGDRIVDARSTGITQGGAEKEERTPQTLGDVIEMLNAADPTRLQARISDDGDHIEIIDLTTDGGYDFEITSFGGGSTAENLGLTGQSVNGELTSKRLQGGLKTVALSTLNGGRGLGELGLLDITDRSGTTKSIDLSAAETVEDVIHAINEAGLGVEASINSAGNGIRIKDNTGEFASNLVIANGDATNSADKLQITNDSSQSSVNSGSLHLQFISEQTTLDSLNGGQGIDRGKFLIKDTNGSGKIIDLADESIKTLGDVIDMINIEFSIDVTARINDNGDGLVLFDTSGGDQAFSISNIGTYKTASDLKIVGTGTSMEVDGETVKAIEGSNVITVEIEDGDTMEDLINQINDLNAGFFANPFNSGSGLNPYRLSIISNVQGASGRINIDSTSSSFDFEEIVKAQDALLLFGSSANASSGVLTSSSTNAFHDIIDGVVLNLGAPSDTPVTISINNSDVSLITTVNAFIGQYNKLRDKLESFTFFSEIENTTGILFGSNETLRIDTELGHLMTDRYFGLGKFQSLQQLGIEISDTGELRLDEAKLKSSFADDPDAVKEFFSKETSGFAAKMNRLTEQFAGKDHSLLISRVQTLQSKIEINFQRIDQMTARLERKEESLFRMFYNLELTLGKLQSNIDSISKIQYIDNSGGTS
ncbi:MAG: hypothetical protein COA78_31560 [Blastopirellula sp.]|nr:MAG: hypothetical protein COA78_31560 [Blastopirellula sp.]